MNVGEIKSSEIHPAPARFSPEQIATDPIIHFFHYSHLPEKLQASSKPFCDLAEHIINNLPRNAERTVALRKLLEAKDAAVRANVPPPPRPTISELENILKRDDVPNITISPDGKIGENQDD